jgi:hypothetical protein
MTTPPDPQQVRRFVHNRWREFLRTGLPRMRHSERMWPELSLLDLQGGQDYDTLAEFLEDAGVDVPPLSESEGDRKRWWNQLIEAIEQEEQEIRAKLLTTFEEVFPQ